MLYILYSINYCLNQVYQLGTFNDSVKTDGWMDAGHLDGKITLHSHPYYEGKPCSKLGVLPPSGLGGDSMTDGLMLDRLIA